MNTTKTSLQKIPVYEVRLVQSRRPLRLAETILTDSRTSARALHALIALTDREHFAALFVNGNHQVTGAHIVAIGAQHAIASIDVRAIFRAALAACASALVRTQSSIREFHPEQRGPHDDRPHHAGREGAVPPDSRPHHRHPPRGPLSLDVRARDAPEHR